MTTPKKSKAKSAISQYLSEIGRKGGRSGKGSPGRMAAAIAGAKARWANHKKKPSSK